MKHKLLYAGAVVLLIGIMLYVLPSSQASQGSAVIGGSVYAVDQNGNKTPLVVSANHNLLSTTWTIDGTVYPSQTTIEIDGWVDITSNVNGAVQAIYFTCRSEFVKGGTSSLFGDWGTDPTAGLPKTPADSTWLTGTLVANTMKRFSLKQLDNANPGLGHTTQWTRDGAMDVLSNWEGFADATWTWRVTYTVSKIVWQASGDTATQTFMPTANNQYIGSVNIVKTSSSITISTSWSSSKSVLAFKLAPALSIGTLDLAPSVTIGSTSIPVSLAIVAVGICMVGVAYKRDFT